MAGRGNARSARRSGTNVNQEQEPKADDSTHCLKITSRQTWTPEQKLDMADDKAQQRPPPDPEEDDLDDLDGKSTSYATSTSLLTPSRST